MKRSTITYINTWVTHTAISLVPIYFFSIKSHFNSFSFLIYIGCKSCCRCIVSSRFSIVYVTFVPFAYLVSFPLCIIKGIYKCHCGLKIIHTLCDSYHYYYFQEDSSICYYLSEIGFKKTYSYSQFSNFAKLLQVAMSFCDFAKAFTKSRYIDTLLF